jgi:hypothetical protein
MLIKVKESKNLSKEQKKYNQFLHKIEQLKAKQKEMEAFPGYIARLYDTHLKEQRERERDMRVDLVKRLDETPLQSKLTKKQLERFYEIMQEETLQLINEYELEETVKPIYDKYADMSFDELADLEKEAALEQTKMFAKMSGVDIDHLTADDLENPEKMAEFMAEMQEQAQKRADEIAEAKAKKKKTKKQLAKEEAAKEVQTGVSQTIKEVYKDLAKRFHPDTASTDEEREYRTEVMKDITGAYQENNFLRLLELQIELTETSSDKIQSLPDEKLAFYNKLLGKQVGEMEQACQMAQMRLQQHPYSWAFKGNEQQTELFLRMEALDYGRIIRSLAYTIEQIEDLKFFKSFIKDYKLESDKVDIFSRFF